MELRTQTLAWGAALAACCVGLGAPGTASAQSYNTTINPPGVVFIPGASDTGNHIDDGMTAIGLPFNFNFYGMPNSSAFVSSNGDLQFTTTGTFPAAYFNGCLPSANFDATICVNWDDLRTDIPAGVSGVFTDTFGTSPNQTFVIEWRAVYFSNTAVSLNFEILLYEGQDFFDIIYSNIPRQGGPDPASGDAGATTGVQAAGAAGSLLTQFSCNTASLTNGLVVRYTFVPPALGACCNDDGSCTVQFGALNCPAPSVFVSSSAMCTPTNTCPGGVTACCVTTTGACTFVGGANCPTGSTPHGTICTPNSCPSTGACCATDGSCTVTQPANCPTPSLIQGLGTTCSGTTNPICPVATTACCNNSTGACTFISTGSCATGTTSSGAVCSPTPCMVTGACCNNTTGACSQIFGGACPTGSSSIAGTTCGPGTPSTSCPFGACCAGCAGCSIVSSAACSPANFRGNGSTCAVACPNDGYSIAPAPPGAAFIPATTSIGLNADDATLAVALPFPVSFYNTPYNSVVVSTNGTLQFTTNNASYINDCLPNATFAGPTIFPFWDDLYTADAANGEGEFTLLSGSSPNQIFVIEFRTVYCCTAGGPINDFEVIFYEGQSFFDVFYGTPMSDRASATIGVQANGAVGSPATQYVCNTAGPGAGTGLRFTCAATFLGNGACCANNGSCTVMANTLCLSPSLFQTVGSACNATAPFCPNVASACCNTTTGACGYVSGTACNAGFQNMGANTVCSPTPCTGACCTNSGGCAVMAITSCASPSLAQSLGSVCGTGGMCPGAVTACCDATTGACTFVSGSSCAAGNPHGSICSPNTCPTTGACCTTNGQCNVTQPANCTAGALFQGLSVACGAGNTCPATTGACCNAFSACIFINGASCPNGYTLSATSAVCSPNTCVGLPSLCQNFDASGGLPTGWTTSVNGGGALWTVTTAQSHSAPNSVTTNDIATVSSQFLVFPTVTAGGNLTVDLWSYFLTEATYDGWVLEYSFDGGGTWNDVGIGGWTLNPYNQAAISTIFMSPIAGRPAFSGTFLTWTEHTATIPANAGDMVTIRIQMASDNSVSPVGSGVWIDDICVGNIQTSSQPGACCSGSTCLMVADAAACAALNPTSVPPGRFTRFTGAGQACNAAGNNTTPCCRADFNQTSFVSVQDLFDFLSSWFAKSPQSDINGNPPCDSGLPGAVPCTSSTGVTVQDLFDFLTIWFGVAHGPPATCP